MYIHVFLYYSYSTGGTRARSNPKPPLAYIFGISRLYRCIYLVISNHVAAAAVLSLTLSVLVYPPPLCAPSFPSYPTTYT